MTDLPVKLFWQIHEFDLIFHLEDGIVSISLLNVYIFVVYGLT